MKINEFTDYQMPTELDYNIMDDIHYFMINDPNFYRKHYFPTIDKAKKDGNNSTIRPLIDTAINLYFKQLLYERRLTNYDIGNKFVSLGIDRRGSIFADSSEPKSIEELYRMNWNVKPTKKGRDSINIGIDVLRRYKLHITESSKELIKEFRTYKYEVDKSGVVLQKPVDKDNHGIDAVRYGCIMTLSRPNFGKYYIS